VYWRSTLEDSAMVADLAAVLRARRGRDDRPAILQPNYVLSSLAWEDGQWRRYDLPELPRAYPRPGLWRAVASARATGVWQPEYHAVWHYDPELRQEATAASAVALEAASRGIMLFPGSEAARELGPWRSDAALAAELDAGLRIFSDLFGSRPRSLIAPDYTWNGRVERLWSSRDLRVIQAKREQRHPDLPAGVAGRLLKVVDRQWSRAAHPDRTYLERNCRLEPVQDTDPMAVARRCVEETARAWERGEPAVVETHRVNFAHVDTAVVGTGLRALAAYLDGVGALPGPGRGFPDGRRDRRAGQERHESRRAGGRTDRPQRHPKPSSGRCRTRRRGCAGEPDVNSPGFRLPRRPAPSRNRGGRGLTNSLCRNRMCISIEFDRYRGYICAIDQFSLFWYSLPVAHRTPSTLEPKGPPGCGFRPADRPGRTSGRQANVHHSLHDRVR
jgi:hypothetical protein